MVFFKSMALIGSITGAFSPLLVGLSLFSFPVPSQAQTIPVGAISLNFPQPPAGAQSGPSRTVGGGVRSGGESCVTKGEGITPLTVIMPINNIGTTLDANPTMFFYVPKTTASLGEIVVVIKQENDKNVEVYVNSEIPIPNKLANQPSIIAIKLDGANLDPNKTYDWSFSLICNPNDRSNEETVEGILQRVTPEANGLPTNTPVDPDLTKLNAVQIVKQAENYAAKGIWMETLEFLAKVNQSKPSEWKGLLGSVDLSQDVINAELNSNIINAPNNE